MSMMDESTKPGVVAGVLTLSCIVCVGVACRVSSPLEGNIVVRGQAMGNFDFTPGVCVASDRVADYHFNGVALVGSKPRTKMILVVLEPNADGYAVLGTRENTKAAWTKTTVKRETCKGLALRIRRRTGRSGTSGHTNPSFEGRFRADCTLPSGDHLKANIEFNDCLANKGRNKVSLME